MSPYEQYASLKPSPALYERRNKKLGHSHSMVEFMPGTVDPFYLVWMILGYCRYLERSKFYRNHETILQNEALLNFRKNESGIFELESKSVNISDQSVIDAYYKLFDGLFFFRTVRKHCPMVLTKTDASQVGILGRAISTIYRGNGNWSWRIEVNLLHEQNRRRRLSSYVATLLHEMLHVYLHRYACHKPTCNPRPTIHKQWESHGEFWQDAAWALERTCAFPHVLGLQLKMGREGSLAYNLTQSHESIPRAMAENWGMTYDDIKMLMGFFGKQNAEYVVVKIFGGKDTMVTKGGVTIKPTKAGKVIQVRGDTTWTEFTEVIELLGNDDGVRVTTLIPGPAGPTFEVKDTKCLMM